eukprot:GHVH01005186.1.p1 GENE.GHVH01005186.1~~GHVH01005186.1.p1  ORF type:complete len:127 (+),score=20.62 GHVH01005186.1:92-472(+)
MTIKSIVLISKSGLPRLSRFYDQTDLKQQTVIIRDLTSKVLSRETGDSNIIETREEKICWRRYASLYFIFTTESQDNELVTLQVMHQFVEVLDKHFGDVCELDLIFQSHRALLVLEWDDCLFGHSF